ncbi:nop16 [Trichoderma cornu-damae]|uniref:Nucleolar protein 16 n=1 Tax=Trichoderma cornu-damae TaxID=654480 RepID=A0A9P8QZ18_9HYPO|nr:nop16 [Trichoderma cornu-damae]
MGRELQKKKRRSGRPAIRQSNTTKKILNPRGNSVIAKNWDKKQTLAQNYRRLGLLARLKTPTGGTEKKLLSTASSSAGPGAASTLRTSESDPFAITTTEKAVLSEAKVERDSDGNIVRILSRKTNPLNDPLNDLDSPSGEEDEGGDAEEWGGINDDGVGTTDVVKSLIEEAKNPAPPKIRYQSEGEREWLEKLVAKYADDTRAMARDPKLNPMQQTASDIAKRLRKMKAWA